jgi:hypothetical protein
MVVHDLWICGFVDLWICGFVDLWILPEAQNNGLQKKGIASNLKCLLAFFRRFLWREGTDRIFVGGR